MKRFILLLVLTILLSSCGPSYPFDSGYSDGLDIEREIQEGRWEAESEPDWQAERSDATQEAEERQQEGEDLIAEYQETERAEESEKADQAETPIKNPKRAVLDERETATAGQAGCEIKGNISIDGEKIYHVPGQRYYTVTVIEPANGERWFCTEEEAESNGWRKSKK